MKWYNPLSFLSSTSTVSQDHVPEDPVPEDPVPKDPDPVPGEIWCSEIEPNNPYPKIIKYHYCEVLEVKSGWVRYLHQYKGEMEIEQFKRDHQKCESPPEPMRGEKWGTEDMSPTGCPFPSLGPSQHSVHVVEVKSRWVRYRFHQDSPAHGLHIMNFINCYYRLS